MKTSLKRSEIIEKLKQILSISYVDIVSESVLDCSKFLRVYVLLVRYNQNDFEHFQVVSITLHYGWIQLEFGNVAIALTKAQLAYLDELKYQSDFLYNDFKSY